MLCYVAYHMFIYQTLLLLVRIHQRFLADSVYHPWYACGYPEDFIFCPTGKQILFHSRICHVRCNIPACFCPVQTVQHDIHIDPLTDGRIKSAVGIGTLLAEGIGDTIRVSLSEPPENEIPVAKALAGYIAGFADDNTDNGKFTSPTDFAPARRKSRAAGNIGGGNPTAVISPLETSTLPDGAILLCGKGVNPAASIMAEAERLYAEGNDSPVVACIAYDDLPEEEIKLRAAADFGRILLNGLQDAIEIRSNVMSDEALYALALNILQATRLRFSHTEYIACPGCGRTLFDLQSTLKAVREATGHLKNLKIGVMGCIVNGPGEMADADYGYVGAAAGHVSLYRGKECVRKNIPQAEAIPALIAFLKEEDVWQEP